VTGWETPQEQPGPAPGVQFAPHGERLVAYIVDVLIVSIVWAVAALLLLFTYGSSANNGPGSGILNATLVLFTMALLLMGILLAFAYFPLFGAWRGQTPGMRLFGLRVVRDSDGGPIGVGRAILRLIGFWINGIVFYVGFVWVFIDARRRGWHDLIAGTVVIKAR
jgi:uncharacterized RDD family membrane protein YckC